MHISGSSVSSSLRARESQGLLRCATAAASGGPVPGRVRRRGRGCRPLCWTSLIPDVISRAVATVRSATSKRPRRIIIGAGNVHGAVRRRRGPGYRAAPVPPRPRVAAQPHQRLHAVARGAVQPHTPQLLTDRRAVEHDRAARRRAGPCRARTCVGCRRHGSGRPGSEFLGDDQGLADQVEALVVEPELARQQPKVFSAWPSTSRAPTARARSIACAGALLADAHCAT